MTTTDESGFRIERDTMGEVRVPADALWRAQTQRAVDSVPPYPASHGCARLSISAMNYLWANDRIPLNTKVWVY